MLSDLNIRIALLMNIIVNSNADTNLIIGLLWCNIQKSI